MPDFFYGFCLGLAVTLSWAVYPSASTSIAMRESARLGVFAIFRGAGLRLILDFLALFGLTLGLRPMLGNPRVETAIYCVSGACLCVLGLCFISRGYTSQLWRFPSDPNAAGAAKWLEDLIVIARSPLFFFWWLLVGPGIVWMVLTRDRPSYAFFGIALGHGLMWLGWSAFLVNATRHHKGLRILDGRVFRALIATGGLCLALLGIYLFYFDVILGTLLPTYVAERPLSF